MRLQLDYRVPYTQSLDFFMALQKMNVPSRLNLYQGRPLGGGAPWTTEQFQRNAAWDKKTGKRL